MTALLTVALVFFAAPSQGAPPDPVSAAPVSAPVDDECSIDPGMQNPCVAPPPPPQPPPPMATVGVGDTLSGLALAWGVDLATVIGANSDQVQDPNQIWPGELLRMPGGIVPPPPPPAPPAPVIATAAPAPVVASGSAPVSHPASGPNHFTFGFCTWYVANRRYVPWFGDAGQWGPAARAMGYAEGPTPRVGAIMVDWEGPIGHVGYVETVHSDGSFVVSEMNFNAWDVVDTRTLPPGGIALETFIY